MKRIVVTEFLTLDGVMQDPGGSEGFERGGWAFKFNRGPEGDRFKMEELEAADTFLLGRVTYEGFAAAWPSRTGDFADRMNNTTKYVVSTTLNRTEWKNSRLIRSNVVEEVRKLKAMPGTDILVSGSGQLVRTLMQSGLVDEVRLMIFPIVLGGGMRLFQDAADSLPLQLMKANPVGHDGVLTLVFRPGSRPERK